MKDIDVEVNINDVDFEWVSEICVENELVKI
jgi:hypothetical protein